MKIVPRTVLPLPEIEPLVQKCECIPCDLFLGLGSDPELERLRGCLTEAALSVTDPAVGDLPKLPLCLIIDADRDGSHNGYVYITHSLNVAPMERKYLHFAPVPCFRSICRYTGAPAEIPPNLILIRNPLRSARQSQYNDELHPR